MRKYWLIGLSALFLIPISELHASDFSPILATPLNFYEQQYGKSWEDETTVQDAFNGNLLAQLFVIGWSRDGKFAYLVNTVGECDDCDTVVIQNLTDDSILWSESGAFLEWGDPTNFTDPWRKLWPGVEAKLIAKGIILAKETAIESFPIDNKEDRVTANLDEQVESNNDTPLVQYKVVVTSKKLGSKVAFQSTTSYSLLGAKILGYFKNPYSDRIAILVGEVDRGHGGPPNDLSLRLVGASLSKGFKGGDITNHETVEKVSVKNKKPTP